MSSRSTASDETSPVTILIAAPQPFYEDRGTPIATRQLATALAALGYRVHLLAYPVGIDQSIPGVTVVRGANPLGLSRVPIGFSLRKLVLDLGMLLTFRGMVRQHRYAAIHAVEEMGFVAVAGGRGRPVVYDMQSSLPDQLRSHAVFRVPPVQWLCRRLERWLVTRATAVVCSAGLKEHVLSLHPHAFVTEMMYLSSAARPDAGRVQELRAQLGIPIDARVVLYSGTFEPYQGLDLLAAAMPLVLQSHPEVVFVLVGATARQSLADDPGVRTLRASRKLHVVPRQERDAIPEYLAMADVLVSPRAYGDNVPLKIFDYMAASRPIVATDIKAHRSLLDEDCAVLVGVSAHGLARGINRVLDDGALAMELAERSRLRSGRGTGEQSFARMVASVYGRVCPVPGALADASM